VVVVLSTSIRKKKKKLRERKKQTGSLTEEEIKGEYSLWQINFCKNEHMKGSIYFAVFG